MEGADQVAIRFILSADRKTIHHLRISAANLSAKSGNASIQLSKSSISTEAAEEVNFPGVTEHLTLGKCDIFDLTFVDEETAHARLVFVFDQPSMGSSSGFTATLPEVTIPLEAVDASAAGEEAEAAPKTKPTPEPTAEPTPEPTAEPTLGPTAEPVAESAAEPAADSWAAIDRDFFREYLSSDLTTVHQLVKDPAKYGIDYDSVERSLGSYRQDPDREWYVFEEGLLARMDKLDRSALSEQDQLAYDTLRQYLLWELEGEEFYGYYEPLTPYTGIQADLPLVFWFYELNSKQDVEDRSEERRVGKECRSRWSPYH